MIVKTHFTLRLTLGQKKRIALTDDKILVRDYGNNCNASNTKQPLIIFIIQSSNQYTSVASLLDRLTPKTTSN